MNRFLQIRVAVASVISLVAMAYVDYITGNELIFSAAYLIPVGICGWYFGWRSVWLMAGASGVMSYLVDVWSGHQYSNEAVRYGNAFTCALVTLVTGLLLYRLARMLRERQRINDHLQQTLAELERSTEEIRRLQNDLQVVCAWTKRIKVGEEWMTPEEFLQTRLHLHVSHGISPEGARAFEAEMRTESVERLKPDAGDGGPA